MPRRHITQAELAEEIEGATYHPKHAPIKIHLTEAQLHKVRAGHPIQIKHAHLGHPQGITFQHIHPEMLKKIHRAYNYRKGVRVHLTPEDFHGTGFKQWLQGAARWVKKNAKFLKPIASAALDAGSMMYPQFAPARASIRGLTGVGLRPTHFVGQPVIDGAYGQGISGATEEFEPFAVRRAPARRRRAPRRGNGIIPAGYAGFS